MVGRARVLRDVVAVESSQLGQGSDWEVPAHSSKGLVQEGHSRLGRTVIVAEDFFEGRNDDGWRTSGGLFTRVVT